MGFEEVSGALDGRSTHTVLLGYAFGTLFRRIISLILRDLIFSILPRLPIPSAPANLLLQLVLLPPIGVFSKFNILPFAEWLLSSLLTTSQKSVDGMLSLRLCCPWAIFRPSEFRCLLVLIASKNVIELKQKREGRMRAIWALPFRYGRSPLLGLHFHSFCAIIWGFLYLRHLEG